MGRTKIEWATDVWNPIRGCSPASSGCTNCFAARMAHRFSGKGKPYEFLTLAPNGKPKWTGEVRLVPELLDQPLRWRKPRRIFVGSMSDLFHEAVPDEFIVQVLTVAKMAPRHTFQVLTKRAARLAEFGTRMPCLTTLKNLWLGVSAENQEMLDRRVPDLLATPAAVRFVSLEPLLGSIDLERIPASAWGNEWDTDEFHGCFLSALSGGSKTATPWHLNWVIVGGETGPGARPCKIEWVRSIVEQCKTAGVPVFVKQDSGPKPGKQGRIPDELWIKEYPAEAGVHGGIQRSTER